MRGLVQKPMLGDECMSDGTNPGDRNNALRLLFNEGSGNKVFDLSGKGNIGTGILNWVPGKFGSALDFNPANGPVTIPDSDSVDLGLGSFAISFWEYVDAFVIGAECIDKRGVLSDDYYQIKHDATGWDTLVRSGAAFYGLMGYNPNVTGMWYHIVLNYDTSNAVSGAGIWANGVRVDTGTTGPAFSNAVPVLIGDSILDGKIDNVLFYNRALSSASEIALLYREPFCDLGPRRFLSFAPAAAGGILTQITNAYMKVSA